MVNKMLNRILGKIVIVFVIINLGGCTALGTTISSSTPSPRIITLIPPTETIAPTVTATPIPTEHIAFVSDRDGNQEIYMMELVDSSVVSLTNLTHNPANDYDPVWSPDGTRIAFASNRDGNAELYVVNIYNQAVIRLTYDMQQGRHEFSVAWSPDGNRLAYVSAQQGNIEIYVVNSDGTNRIDLSNDPAWDIYPSWSPDGGAIVFASKLGGVFLLDRSGIYIVRIDTFEVTLLAECPAGPDTSCGEFLWSPDGRFLVFTRVTGDADSTFYSIYAMNSDGSNMRLVVPADFWSRGFRWSPDLTKVAYEKAYDHEACMFDYPNCNVEIHTTNADGSGDIRITNTPGLDISPAWSHDNRYIAFVSTRDGNNEIYFMNSDGSFQVNLTNNPADDHDPVWSPDFGSAYLPAEATKPIQTPPSETPLPKPAIRNFFTCLEKCEEDESNTIAVFPEKITKIYLHWEYENIPSGAQYSRAWSNNGIEWIRYECIWPGPADGVDNIAFIEPYGLRSGIWVITITVNGQVLLQKQIEIEGDWDYWDPAGTIYACYGTVP